MTCLIRMKVCYNLFGCSIIYVLCFIRDVVIVILHSSSKYIPIPWTCKAFIQFVEVGEGG